MRIGHRSGSRHEKVSKSANGSPSGRCSEMGVSPSARATEVISKARRARESIAQAGLRQETFSTGLRFMTRIPALTGHRSSLNSAQPSILERLGSANSTTGAAHPERLRKFNEAGCRSVPLLPSISHVSRLQDVSPRGILTR